MTARLILIVLALTLIGCSQNAPKPTPTPLPSSPPVVAAAPAAYGGTDVSTGGD